jgi:hypothetical protein
MTRKNFATRSSLLAARRRRGQIFTLDFLFGLFIMTLALLALLVYNPTKAAPFRDDIERVSVLMTEGEPVTWNATSVAVPGFLTDDRLNETKVLAFASLPLQTQRQLLGVQSHFAITIYHNNTVLSACASCGEPFPAEYDDLLVLRRYTLLNGSVARMEVTLWQ